MAVYGLIAVACAEVGLAVLGGCVRAVCRLRGDLAVHVAAAAIDRADLTGRLIQRVIYHHHHGCICDRFLLGPDKIVGATAKTVEAAVAAYNDGADYLGTGAIYPTTTHVTTKVTPVSVLNDVCRAVPIPVVAIGGLNADNMDVLADSPIKGIAVVSAVMKADDPRAAAAHIKEKFLKMMNK